MAKVIRTQWMIYVFILLILISITMRPDNAGCREKIAVAIAEVNDQTGRSLSGTATDRLTKIFIRAGNMRVVERQIFDDLLNELGLQQQDIFSAENAPRLGEMIGAGYLVSLSLSGAGYNKTVERHKDEEGNVYTTIKATASINVSLRMIDIESGEISFSTNKRGSVTDSAIHPSQPKPEHVLIDKALSKALDDIFHDLQEAFPTIGYVIKKEGNIIWIDIGTEWGVGKYRRVEFFREGEQIKHPITGEILGGEIEVLAKGRVTDALPKISKIKLSKKKASKIKVGDSTKVLPKVFYSGITEE